MFHLCFLNDFFFMSLVDLYSLILFRSFFVCGCTLTFALIFFLIFVCRYILFPMPLDKDQQSHSLPLIQTDIYFCDYLLWI